MNIYYRASSDAELPGNLPSLEGKQSVDSSQDYFSVLSETRDFTSLECIEIQDTEPLDLSSLDVANPKSPTRNKESRSEVKDCPVSAVSHDRSQKRQFTGKSLKNKWVLKINYCKSLLSLCLVIKGFDEKLHQHHKVLFEHVLLFKAPVSTNLLQLIRIQILMKMKLF